MMNSQPQTNLIREGLESINQIILSVAGTTQGCKIKETPIEKDFLISKNVLGTGISGKILQCTKKLQNSADPSNAKKYALKVLIDSEKIRREINIHWMARKCPYVVHVEDVYQNTYINQKCLLMVMECMEGGELFARIDEVKIILLLIQKINYH